MKNQILNSGGKVQTGDALAVQVAPFGDFKGTLHSTNGETWAISWADKVYVRSIQERAKNNPPYKT